MRTSATIRVALAALALVLAAGCGGAGGKASPKVTKPADPDAAWKADLAAIGIHPIWTKYKRLVENSTCTNDDYVTYIAVGMDTDYANPASDRIGIKYACPGRLADWDKAFSTASGYKERGLSLCGRRGKLVERMAVMYQLSAPSVPTDGEVLDAVC